MATIERTPSDNAIEREALAWMDDPHRHFGYSVTKVHSVPREEAEAVQLAGINLRLQQRRGQIKVLEKLADAQGIASIDTLDDAAALFMAHDVYKSYPVSLLAKQRFDQLSTWLSRLTHYDPTQVDVSDCRTIDDWLVKLQAETPLDVATSSGSTGTLSFFPKSKRDYMHMVEGMRVNLSHPFGTEPSNEDINGKIHAILPLHRDGHATAGRTSHYIRKVFCKDDEDHFHPCFDFKVSTDLLWLAGRLRAAAAKGDVTKVDVPPALLARRAEYEANQKDMPAQQTAFILEMIEKLRGERVLALGLTNLFYGVARRGLDQGLKASFAPGTRVMGGGGAKGIVLPDDAEQTICDFFGVERMGSSYGMTEMNAMMIACEHGHYHVQPWVAVYQLDVETGRPLPREGVQAGRAAFFDLTQDGTWGGIVTGDRIVVDWDTPCPCGRTTVGLRTTVQRLSELQGGTDKITCAAVPAAQAEAMDYLTALDR
jgi:hypothetical protein